jgi:hypothetical protein
MIRCWGGDKGATLVAARRTTTLGRCNLPLKPMSRNDVGFCRGMMGVFRGRPLSCWGWFPSRWRFPWKLGFHVPGLSSVGFLPLERSCTDSVITGIWAKSVNKRAIGLFKYRCRRSMFLEEILVMVEHYVGLMALLRHAGVTFVCWLDRQRVESQCLCSRRVLVWRAQRAVSFDDTWLTAAITSEFHFDRFSWF